MPVSLKVDGLNADRNNKGALAGDMANPGFQFSLISRLTDGVYLKDASLRYRLVNPAMLRILGVASEEDVLGKTDRDLSDTPAALLREKLDRETLTLNRPLLNQEEKISIPGEGEHWYLISRVPVPDNTGTTPAAVLGICRDITDRRAMEEKLARNEERLRYILEFSRDIAYLYDLSSHCYEYISPSVTTLLGHTVDNPMSISQADVEAMVHPDDLDHVRAHRKRLLEAQRKGEPLPLCEYRLRNSRGEYRLFSEASAFILDSAGKPKALVGNLRDITEARRISEALRVASRMETAATLAGGVAHDFNNLLASIMTNAELLEIKTRNDPEAAGIVQEIIRCAEDGSALTDQLLAFARGGRYNPQPVQLNDIVRKSRDTLAGTVPPNIRLELSLRESLPLTRIDPSQMRQVIFNLVQNAVEAITESGQINLGTDTVTVPPETAAEYPGLRPGKYVALFVEDTGHGMTAEVQERLFEPFFTTRFSGRGLGLAAVYGIVKNHDGYIYADSAPGAGTRMTVLLPECDAQPQPAAPPAQMRLPMGSETILVVDDEEPILTATRMLLERLGYRVLCAKNGREGVELLEKAPGTVHLVILDMAMPVMAGPEAFARMRQIRPDLPVIIASGFDLNETIQQVLDSGAKAFLKKPVRMQQLAAAIREALDN
ncbi:MAG TPA: response regulator [Candidatus Hydrogenedentes bacterium]|nr:response regulator [Candidatus Hydrogenedentota bacterium]HPU98153.1 response regulator [Candidatus Hydrogenedentota bacterium]